MEKKKENVECMDSAWKGNCGMKNQNALNAREEELLCFLWEENEAMTSAEMAEKLKEREWNNITVFKTVQSLTEKEYLKVDSLKKAAKTYARRMTPSLSKEEYYSSVLKEKGFDRASLTGLVASFLGSSKKGKKERDAEVIRTLEAMIEQIRNSDEN